MWSLHQTTRPGARSSGAARPRQHQRQHRLPVLAKQTLPAEGRHDRPAMHSRLGDQEQTALAIPLPVSAAVGSAIKYQLKPGKSPTPLPTSNPVSSFMTKVRAAWDIFFPTQADVTPKEEGKQRLRMILVADRCGMSPAGLTEMKKTILRALEEYVDIECEEQIDVSINVDPSVGTVYCVAVPIRTVKPEARMALDSEGMLGEDGSLEFQYDPEDWNSDPSERFPYGC